MLVKFRKSIIKIVAIGLFLTPGLIVAAPLEIVPTFPPLHEGSCNKTGECSFDISNFSETILLACDTPSASINWNKKHKGSFFIACDCQCTAHDNIGWLIDLNNNVYEKVEELEVGKAFTVEDLGKQMENFPDIISSHPLCENVDKEQLNNSIFVPLIKRPIKSQFQPYCFSPLYITTEGDNSKTITKIPGKDFSGRTHELNDNQSFKNYILESTKEFSQTHNQQYRFESFSKENPTH